LSGCTFGRIAAAKLDMSASCTIESLPNSSAAPLRHFP
jgi:hypothetical protein